MSIPKKPRTLAQAPSAGVGSGSGVGPGRPEGNEIRSAWARAGFFAAFPLTLALSVTLAGCSDDADRIDQNYGKDVGAGYHLPKDASDDSGSAPADSAAPAVDAGAGTDPDAAASDAGLVAPDAPQVEPSDATADGAGEATTG
jgi:hypothetical protein